MGYFGSKATSGLCQPLIAMIPPHDTYIETHLGGGAIMKRKPAALRNIGIDRDARALDAFECDYPVELVHGCAHRYLAEFEFQGSELVYSDPPHGRASTPVIVRSRPFISFPEASSRSGLPDFLDRQRRVEQLLQVASRRSPAPAMPRNAPRLVRRRDLGVGDGPASAGRGQGAHCTPSRLISVTVSCPSLV